MRGEPADVFPATIGQASAHTVDFIESISEEENHVVLGWLNPMGTEKCPALHLFGFFGACE